MCCCYEHIQTQDIFEIAQVLNLDAPTIIYLYHMFLAMFWSGSVAATDCGCPEKYIDIDRSGTKWDRKVGCSCACAWTLVVLDGKVCWACDPSMFTVSQCEPAGSFAIFTLLVLAEAAFASASWMAGMEPPITWEFYRGWGWKMNLKLIWIGKRLISNVVLSNQTGLSRVSP